MIKKNNITKILLYILAALIVLFIIYLISSNIVEKYVNSPPKNVDVKLYLFYKYKDGLPQEDIDKLANYKQIYNELKEHIIKYNNKYGNKKISINFNSDIYDITQKGKGVDLANSLKLNNQPLIYISIDNKSFSYYSNEKEEEIFKIYKNYMNKIK